MDSQVVTLTNLADGAAVELFQEALSSVLRNIAEPNTDAKTVREISLKVRIKPNEERQVGDVLLSTAVKLASLKGVHALVYIGRHAGEYVAVEQPRQLTFDETPAELRGVKGGKE
jgi:hypothetical protein